MIRFLWIALLALLFLYPMAAQSQMGELHQLNITEEDGSPSTFPVIVEFPNGSLTEDSTSTTSVSFSGGGGGTGYEWIDTGTVLHPAEIGDDIALGATTVVQGSKLSVDGDADQIQLLVQGNSTQTGNVVVFQDSVAQNLWRMDNSGNVVIVSGASFSIGTDSTAAVLDVQGDGNLANAHVRFANFNNTNNNGVYLTIDRARGTQASPAAIQGQDEIFKLILRGRDSSGQFNESSAIFFEVDGTPGNGDMPGRIVLLTTPDGNSTPLARMTIVENGDVGIGTAAPDGLLHIFTASAGSISSGSGADELTIENSGDSGITIFSGDNNFSQIHFGSAADTIGAVLRWQQTQDLMTLGTSNAGAELAFLTAVLSEAMRIDADGNVGIGDTTPDDLFVVGSSSEFQVASSGNITTAGTLSLGGATGGRLSASGGVFTLGGIGNTNNEDVTFDLESSANIMQLGSTTGVIQFRFPDLFMHTWGSGSDFSIRQSTTGSNDSIQFLIGVGAQGQSGYLNLLERADSNSTNRAPSSTTPDPTLRIYSADATQANDFLELSHDQTNATFNWGNGALDLDGGDVNITAGDLAIDVNNANITIQHPGGDEFGWHTEVGSIMYLKNNTDRIGYLLVDNLHNLYLGTQDGVGADVPSIWLTSTDNLRFSTNNTVRIKVNSSGNVGINVTNPDAMLEISTNSATEEGLKIKGSASQSGHLFLMTDDSDVTFFSSGDGLAGSQVTWNDTNADIDFLIKGDGTNAFFVDAGKDNVGIGTNNPNATVKLDVNGEVNALTGTSNGYSIALRQVVRANSNVLEFANNTNWTDVVWNEGSFDINHRFEGDADENLFVLDAGLDRAAFGTNTGSEIDGKLNVKGDFNLVQAADNITVAGANPKKSIYIPATAMWPSTTNGASVITLRELGTNDVDLQTIDFDTTTQEFAQFNLIMPKNWDAGTVTYHVDWTTSETDTGGVVWELQGTSFANDNALDAAFGTAIEIADTFLLANDLHETAESAALTLAGGPVAGEYTHWRIARDPANGSDTKAGDADLIGIRIEYAISKYTDT